MGYLLVEGGRPLSGRIAVEGAKNAALPACVASLLTDGPIVLHRIPQLRDVSTILFTIGELGKRVIRNGPDLLIAGAPLSFEANPYSVRQMRASFLVLGPLVARFGRAVVPLPGGCSIGPRPVDLHLKGLQALGARVEERDGAVAVMADRLRGCRIELPFPSVGATEQLLMVASLADGETEIANGAIEPEVIDLVSLLRKMGSNVEIDGRTFRIEGRTSLSGAEHTLIPDRWRGHGRRGGAGSSRGVPRGALCVRADDRGGGRRADRRAARPAGTGGGEDRTASGVPDRAG